MAKKTAVKKQAKKAAGVKRTRKAEGPATQGACFVISPFNTWFDNYYDTIFAPAIVAVGLKACRADDLYRPSSIIHDIWSYVQKAQVLLADLTGKNPNVLYELGLAHAIGKPVVMVTQSLDDVPFDLRNLRVISYDLRDPAWGDDLKENIQFALSEVLQAPASAVPPVFLREQTESKVPTVSPLEKKVLELSQQVQVLRRSERTEESTRVIDASEARFLMKRYVRMGLDRSNIIERLRRRGAPVEWIERELVRVRSESKQEELILDDDDIPEKK